MTCETLPRAAPVSGPVLFGRYAFGPNRLGYCGTDDHAALLGHAATRDDPALRTLARTFDGAYPYLQLIASSAGIADPLDRRVVEAYWLGNELTAGVTRADLHRSMQGRFRGRMASTGWSWLEATVPAGAGPVHAFHVLDVFPRVGLLRGEQADDLLKVIDSCRIRWGRVLSVDAGWMVVATPTLELIDGKLRIGAAREEKVERWVDGIGFVDDVAPGDTVSLHWGWACDRLTPRQLANLVRWTDHQLRIANRAI
ncbi:MAG TPA: DUF6390 family protein [Candidatus Limnocylindrales bacterium]|nr:DUF6390 family protein [Candidatus Limnocylindrales bacterium]